MGPMTPFLATALQQSTGTSLAELPWGVILTVFLICCGIVVVLVSDRLRRPTHFVTSIEQEASENKVLSTVKLLEREVTELSRDVRDWEREFRDSCATKDAVEALISRVELVERFNLSVQDSSTQAREDAKAALHEVSRMQADLGRLTQNMEEMRTNVSTSTATLGRVEGQLDILVKSFLAGNNRTGRSS